MNPDLITHFYSDPHFGHKNIIEFCGRPFVDVDHMNERLVEEYNYVVTMQSVVLWCGDCFFTSKAEAAHILSQMKGRKWLVIGNHDRSKKSMLDIGFEYVVDTLFMDLGGQRCRVNHYPYWEERIGDDGFADGRYKELRPPRVEGEILIHGHTHSKHRVRENMVHVGVDAWDYRPATRAEIEKCVHGVALLRRIAVAAEEHGTYGTGTDE